ncbi:uncharacterized protein J3D65DRAFT_481206 [Phyllosticta citribraziliensis]|uniref:Uncharacterized protein n=1 Tax=Phyllosticta citribraziliensis TaxID=989973 RepID=A0ABR1LGH0_9PEZI
MAMARRPTSPHIGDARTDRRTHASCGNRDLPFHRRDPLPTQASVAHARLLSWSIQVPYRTHGSPLSQPHFITTTRQTRWAPGISPPQSPVGYGTARCATLRELLRPALTCDCLAVDAAASAKTAHVRSSSCLLMATGRPRQTKQVDCWPRTPLWSFPRIKGDAWLSSAHAHRRKAIVSQWPNTRAPTDDDKMQDTEARDPTGRQQTIFADTTRRAQPDVGNDHDVVVVIRIVDLSAAAPLQTCHVVGRHYGGANVPCQTIKSESHHARAATAAASSAWQPSLQPASHMVCPFRRRAWWL